MDQLKSYEATEADQRLFSKDEKKTVGLLSIGTFLEYFDLMLYVHMAVLLNELFFPKTDPHTANLLSAFAFCSTYLLRPFGALIFGWIGDHIGRKVTIVITTTMMALSCIIMANLPTFAQIGITAAWIVSICRIVQGMTSMGEITGAQLYLTEYFKASARYVSVAMMNFCAAIGTFAALGMAYFVTSHALNWRIAFWVGACIALIGMVARTTLRETPEFADAKRRLNRTLNQFKEVGANISNTVNTITKERVSWKTTISLLLVDCMWPVLFYFVYVHCGNILKHNFKYTADQIIQNNFTVSFVVVINTILVVTLSRTINPLKILTVKLIFSTITLIAAPFLLNNADSGFEVLLIQCLVIFFACDASPANSIFFKYFPVFKRFTYGSVIYATSRAVVYLITSVSLVYLTETLGHCGLFIIIIPTIIGFALGLVYFLNSEKVAKGFSERGSAI